MPSDPPAGLTRLQEQEEWAVGPMEEHRRQIATLEARIEAAEEGVARAGPETAAPRERIAAAERAPPADPRDGDEEA
jgi:hypothetical protein